MIACFFHFLVLFYVEFVLNKLLVITIFIHSFLQEAPPCARLMLPTISGPTRGTELTVGKLWFLFSRISGNRIIRPMLVGFD